MSDHEVTFAVDPSRAAGLTARCSCGRAWHDTSPLAPKIVADQVVEHLRDVRKGGNLRRNQQQEQRRWQSKQ